MKIYNLIEYLWNDELGEYEMVRADFEEFDAEIPIAQCGPAAVPIAIALAKIVAAILIAYIAQKILYKEPDLRTSDEGNERGIKANTRSTQQSVRIVYGKRRVGGNDVYGRTGGKYNKDLFLATTLSEGECEGLDTDEDDEQLVYIDGKTAQRTSGDSGKRGRFGRTLVKKDKYWVEEEYTTTDRDGNTVTRTRRRRKERKIRQDTVQYRFYNGTNTQTADDWLSASGSGDFTDPMRNTCYIVYRLFWNEDKFRGVPQREVVLKGIKCKDMQDFDADKSWTDNPVDCLYDFLTNDRYGIGIPADKIDLPSFESAAAYCDLKSFTCNMVIHLENQNAWDIVQDILNLFRGTVTYFDGKYYVYVSDTNEEVVQKTINDVNIAQGGNGKAAIRLTQPSRYETPNGLRVSFIDHEKDYTEDAIILGDQVGVIEDVMLVGCTNRSQAALIGTTMLERKKLNRTIAGSFSDDCIELEPHDIVTLNTSALAISGALMRVVSTDITDNGLINMTMQYETDDLYNDTYEVDITNLYETTLPDPDEPARIENVTIYEQIYNFRLRTFSRIVVEFGVPEDEAWFSHVEEWRYVTSGAGGVTFGAPSASEYSMMGIHTDDFKIEDVEEGETYWIKLRTVNIFGVKEDLEKCTTLSLLVQGVANTPPACLTYLDAIPGDGNVKLVSDKLDDPNIEIYEFRLGQTWIEGLFYTAKRSPQESIMNVKPGTHYFTANTKSTHGIYGECPVQANDGAGVTIEIPVGWYLQDQFVDPYTPAGSRTFSGTQHTTIGGGDYLRCTHSTELSGTYLSEVFDTGVAAIKYYAWVDFDVILTGVDNTWDAVLGTSPAGTWDGIQAYVRSWNDIFQIEESSRVKVKLRHKRNAGDAWSVVENAEISAAVLVARYFQVEIEIIDPSQEVFANIEEFTLNLYDATP